MIEHEGTVRERILSYFIARETTWTRKQTSLLPTTRRC